MRRLTFKGYLEPYVQYLAGEHTVSLRRLVAVTRSESRVVAPLLLWAVKSGRAERLAALLRDRGDMRDVLETLVSLERRGDLEPALARADPSLSPEYWKVWRSFVARRDGPVRDAGLKLQARRRVLALEAAKGVTRYRMAKDLGLNPGNLHAFLSQGNASRLSLDRACRLVEYLETA